MSLSAISGITIEGQPQELSSFLRSGVAYVVWHSPINIAQKRLSWKPHNTLDFTEIIPQLGQPFPRRRRALRPGDRSGCGGLGRRHRSGRLHERVPLHRPVPSAYRSVDLRPYAALRGFGAEARVPYNHTRIRTGSSTTRRPRTSVSTGA